jgi:hypothetical protein
VSEEIPPALARLVDEIMAERGDPALRMERLERALVKLVEANEMLATSLEESQRILESHAWLLKEQTAISNRLARRIGELEEKT